MGELFSSLVGEGKTYRDEEALAASRIEANKHITNIESENQTLRKLLAETTKVEDRSATMQEILSKLQSNGTSQPLPTGGASTSQGTVNQTAGLTLEDVRKLLLETERAKAAEVNLKTVNATLTSVFGDEAKVKEAIAVRATELGVSEDALKSLAASAPKAYLRMLGLDNQKPSGGSVAARGAVNTSGMEPDQGVRNEAWYERKKQEMGGAVKFALDTRIQQQLHKDMEALGDKFFVSN